MTRGEVVRIIAVLVVTLLVFWGALVLFAQT